MFSVPDKTGLSDTQKDVVLDTYAKASRSVFYLWVGCIGIAWLLMFLIKDKGLQRKEEKAAAEQKAETQGRREDEESGSANASGDERDPSRDEKVSAQDLVTSIPWDNKKQCWQILTYRFQTYNQDRTLLGPFISVYMSHLTLLVPHHCATVCYPPWRLLVVASTLWQRHCDMLVVACEKAYIDSRIP